MLSTSFPLSRHDEVACRPCYPILMNKEFNREEINENIYNEIEAPLEGGRAAGPGGVTTGPRPEIITTEKGLKLAKCYVCSHFVPLNVIKRHVKLRHA